jgi:hypothetical protein
MNNPSLAEESAIQYAVAMGGRTPLRVLVAIALRTHRGAGNRSRARWLRKHIIFITGHTGEK